MSAKYPVQYVSGSKKSSLNIEDMVTSHLCNAWRKLVKDETHPDQFELVKAMDEELRARGGIFDSETGQWDFPPKPESAGATP